MKLSNEQLREALVAAGHKDVARALDEKLAEPAEQDMNVLIRRAASRGGDEPPEDMNAAIRRATGREPPQ